MCMDISKENNKRKILMIPQLNFTQQNNVNLCGISPLYDEVKGNIMWSFTSKYDRLLNDNVYIMKNSKIININQNSLEINGIILDAEPKFGTEYLVIITNLLNDTRVNIGCNAYQESQTNYTFKCIWDRNFKIKLDTPVAFIDDENILLIYFVNRNSIVTMEENLNRNSLYSLYTKKTASGGLKRGNYFCCC